MSVLDEVKKLHSMKGSFTSTHKGNTYTFEILGVNTADGDVPGVEVMARVYLKGKQLGFGKDGTVDIERFIIYNPPTLVEDPKGEIVRTIKGELGQTKVKLRQDFKEAMLRTLAHTVFVTGKSTGKVVKGKVGRTTSTFYPDPDPETNTCDGYTGQSGNASWATIHGGSGDEASTNNNEDIMLVRASSTTNQYDRIRRFAFLFDTSSIPDDDNIDSATFSVYPTEIFDDFTDSVTLTTCTPASNTSLANGDYTQFGTTKQATDKTLASMSTGAYEDWTLNATGEGNISKTGITKFALRMTSDNDNSEPTWASASRSWLKMRMADTSGTASDPKLVVEHSSGTAYTEEFTDTVTMVDDKALQTEKITTDTLTLADSAAKLASRFYTEVVTLVSSIANGLITARAVQETLTLADDISRTVGKVTTDVVTMVDGAAKSVQKGFTDVITLVASAATEVSIGRAFTETITLVESYSQTLSRALTETITLVETFTKRLSALLLTEVITLVEGFSTVKTQFKSFTETLPLVEGFTTVVTATRAFTETITLRSKTFLDGVNAAWVKKYTSKAGSWVRKYYDPK